MQALKTYLILLKNPGKKIRDNKNENIDFQVYEVKIIFWILLLTGIVGITLFLNLKSGLSFGFGGLISIFSFYITEKGILKFLQPNQPSAGAKIVRRYYLKLAAIILIIGMAIKERMVEIVPLLAGLSIIIIAVTFFGIKNFIKNKLN